MQSCSVKIAVLAALALTVACAGTTSETGQGHGSAEGDNVLLAEWTGPYEGVPAFDRMDLGQLKDALERALGHRLGSGDRNRGDRVERPLRPGRLQAERRGAGRNAH